MPITTKLQGGCGNQMFQYAMGFSQARCLGTELQIDNSSFKRDGMREYNLCLFPRITEKIVEDFTATTHEVGMPYNKAIVDSIQDGEVLKGYWQTEKYFANIAKELREKFQPKPLTWEQLSWAKEINRSCNPTFLTIRRTDYVGNTFHGELPIAYYEEALKIIAEKTGEPDLFVFTDDIPWCLENLHLPYDFQVAGTYDRTVKGHVGREDADLYLMSLCKNAVMANSSFSWWGAWLGDNARKSNGGVVVAPKCWFGWRSNENPKDIIPNRWCSV